MWAVSYGHEGIVSYLLHKGANSSLTTWAGMSAFKFANAGGYEKIASIIEKDILQKEWGKKGLSS